MSDRNSARARRITTVGRLMRQSETNARVRGR
jgi:hypothetical protein